MYRRVPYVLYSGMVLRPKSNIFTQHRSYSDSHLFTAYLEEESTFEHSAAWYSCGVNITYLQSNSQQEILYNSFRRQVAETFFSAVFISVATFEQTGYWNWDLKVFFSSCSRAFNEFDMHFKFPPNSLRGFLKSEHSVPLSTFRLFLKANAPLQCARNSKTALIL